MICPRPLAPIAAIVGLLVASICDAATYYVAPTATSTNWAAATSIASPCTAQTAFDNANAGDVVEFRGGTYSIPPRNTGIWLTGYYAPNHSGTAESPIIFKAYPGEQPVFDGASGGSADRDGHGYYHYATIMSNARYTSSGTVFHEYIVFDGFYFRSDGGVNEARIALTGGDNFFDGQRVRGLVVRNCTLDGGTWVNEARVGDTGTGDNHEGIFVSQTTGLVISNCRIFGYRVADNHYNTSGIKTYHSDHIRIENCEVSDCSWGIYSKTNTIDLEVARCYIHHCYQGFITGAGGWWVDSSDHSKGYLAYENTNNVLHHNLFAYNTRGPVVALTQDGGDVDGFEFYNNTVYAASGSSASCALGSGLRQSFYNNILYGPKIDSDIGLLRWACGDNVAADVAAGKTEVNFGLVAADHNQFGNLSDNFLIRVKRPNESCRNFTSLAAWQVSGALADGSNPGTGSLASNPLFLNASGAFTSVADFALQPGSPCLGTGRDGGNMGADIPNTGILGSTTDTTAPTVPTNLSGNATSPTQIHLTWTAATDNVGVAGYRIYRGGAQVGTSTTAAYNDSGLTAATTYSYSVAAIDAAGNASAQCTAVTVTTSAAPDTAAPTVPTNLSGNATSPTQIHLTWTASTDNVGVTGYRVYRGGTQVGTSTTAAYNDSGLTAATVYSYSVAAIDAAGNASAQCTAVTVTTSAALDTTAPSVPTSLSGNATSPTQIHLTWTASTDNVGVAGYRIYRGGTQVGTSTTAAYNDSGLTAATTYSYSVAAIDAAGNASAQCAAVTVTTMATPDTAAPSVPTNLAGNATSPTQVHLSWTVSTDNVGVTGYRIYRGGTQVGTSTTSSYNDSGLTAATAYSYSVAAIDAAGNASAQCTAVSVTTQISGTQTLTVSDAAGLQAALATAAANPSATYTITVSAGTYTPTAGLTVSASNLTLEGGGIFSGSGLSSGALLTISGDNVVLSGLGFRLAPGAAISIAAGADHGAIADCTFAGAGIAGTGCSGWTLTGNTLNDTTAAALTFSGADDLTLTDNIIVDCAQTIVLTRLSGPKVRNNFIANNRVNSTAASIALTDVTSAQIDNNSLYQAGTAANAIEYSGSAPIGAIRNNLTNKPIAATGTATATLATNCTTAAANWFRDTTTADLHLTSTQSAVVDAGTTLNDLTVDIDGDPRPTGLAFDIGADEYQPDTIAPTPPGALSATASSATQIALTWSASTDTAPSGATATGVSGYRIYRNGTAAGTSATTSYSDTGLTAGTTYTYTVTAFDGAANESAASASASATTKTASSDSGKQSPSSSGGGGGGANSPHLIVTLALLYALRRKLRTP